MGTSKKGRSALIGGLFVALVILLQGCMESEPQKHSWQLQSQATKSSLDFQELEKFAQQVSVMSAGRLEIQVYPSGEITSGADIYTAVKDGRIQMGNGWPNWWSGNNPAWALLNAGPFDFMNIDASMMFFLSGPGVELANSLSRPQGIIWRPAWWPGMEFGLISRQPIRGLADLQGRKVRIGPGLPSEVLTAASGAYTIPLLPEEIRSALESGDIDAVEWTTTTGAWDLGLSDIGRHAIVPAVWQPSVLSDFLINEQAYAALPADLQSILDAALKSFTLSTTLKAKVSDFAALKKFSAAGVNIETWSEQDIDKWREVTAQVMERYAQQSDINRQIIEQKAAFKKRYNEYYEWFGSYE